MATPFRAGSPRGVTACSPWTAPRCTRHSTASRIASGSRPRGGSPRNNRKAKYYTLTAAGRAQLRSESAVWQTYADAVAKVLSPG